MAGCENSGYVDEHPVENQIPALKPGVYSVDSVDLRPVATHQVEPDYPFELESILGGFAAVVFTVRADGKVSDASVVRADDVLFGEAALSAIRKWRFSPAQVKGVAVDCRMKLPFYFATPVGLYSRDESMPDPPNGKPPNDSRPTTIEQR